MQKKTYWFIGAALILIIGSYFIGFNSNSELDSFNPTPSFSSNSSDSTAKQTSSEQVLASTSQKIYQADIEYRVNDSNKAVQQLAQLASKYQATLTQSDDDQEHDSHEVRISYQVPQTQFAAFVDHSKKIADTVSKIQITADDVSEQLVDLQARIKAKRTLQTQLLAMSNRATTTSELLDIEQTLDNVQTELERLTAQQQYLQHHVAFSTVSFTIKTAQWELPTTHLSLIDESIQQFVLSCKTLWIGLQLGIIWLATALPYLLGIAIIASVIIVFIRKRKRA